MIYYSEYESPLGTVIMLSEGAALTGLHMLERNRYVDTTLSVSERNDCLGVFSETRLWLDQYFSGDRPVIMPKMKLKGTVFQKLVWETLLSVPYGSVTTYGQIAKVIAERMGRRTMSAQVIGNAVGRNPIMILVPCHRVVKADGSIGGFSAGVERKRWLLEHEKQQGG